MNIYEELKWRGLIKDVSSPDLEQKLNNEKLTFYIGTDPTADSMHIGHFSSFLIATRLAKRGHKPILLIGGATGLIGDPKPSKERPMITKEEVEKNVKGLTKQAKEIFGFEVVNNYDWSKNVNFVDFFRDYGKYISVNYMLDKDIIKRRLDSGITYCEFSYMMMQAMDFVHLYEDKGVTLQVAGSDQWGNITTGIELARKKLDTELYGFTMPLVLDSNGVKFGKTEGNALWLDKTKTSSYELYQYLINSSDDIIIDYLKKLTFYTKDEIEEIEKIHLQNKEQRYAQEKLAESVITFLHGENSYKEAKNISNALFKGNTKDLTEEEIKSLQTSMPSFEIDVEKDIIDILIDTKIFTSKREVREFINAKAININGEPVTDEHQKLDNQRTYNILRKGKKKYFILKNW